MEMDEGSRKRGPQQTGGRGNDKLTPEQTPWWYESDRVNNIYRLTLDQRQSREMSSELQAGRRSKVEGL